MSEERFDAFPIAAPVPALAPDDGKVPCPECGQRFMAAGMGVHRSIRHGYKGKKSQRKPRAAPSNHSAPRPPRIDLTVDEIFDAVVSQMFPRGTAPVAALTPLLRWRRATEEMLNEVQGHGR
jgi:hypothetical protein